MRILSFLKASYDNIIYSENGGNNIKKFLVLLF